VEGFSSVRKVNKKPIADFSGIYHHDDANASYWFSCDGRHCGDAKPRMSSSQPRLPKEQRCVLAYLKTNGPSKRQAILKAGELDVVKCGSESIRKALTPLTASGLIRRLNPNEMEAVYDLTEEGRRVELG